MVVALIATASPASAFQCAIGGQNETLKKTAAVFEVVVHTIWRDDTYEPPDMWTSGAVYARATTTRVLKGTPPSEVLLHMVKMECEGCPDEAATMFRSLQNESTMLVVAREPRRVGDAVIYSPNVCLEEALEYSGWLARAKSGRD